MLTRVPVSRVAGSLRKVWLAVKPVIVPGVVVLATTSNTTLKSGRIGLVSSMFGVSPEQITCSSALATTTGSGSTVTVKVNGSPIQALAGMVVPSPKLTAK